MASLEQRAGKFRIIFRFSGQKFSRTLKTRDERAAHGALARLEDNLRRIELGTLDLPEDADIATFLLSDGKIASRPKLAATRTLKQLCDRFFESLPTGSIEESTIKG